MQGPTPIVEYTSSNYTSMAPGNTYKGAIDVCTSILSSLTTFFVTQTSPASMNVQVDVGYNFMLGGAGPTFQPTASPVTVALVAPTANSYYATVYWDSVANTFGVVYGATGTSPVPTLPDSWHQKVLAYVLIANGQTSISASNIIDGRFVDLFPCEVEESITASTAQSIDCFGAKIVRAYLSMSAAWTLTLNNLMYGTDVHIMGVATSGNHNLKVAASTPSGVSLTALVALNPAESNATGAAAANLTTGGTIIYSGANSVVLKSAWSRSNQTIFFS